jgi:hypothetical protein
MTKWPKFRKRPVVIEAVQWTGNNIGVIEEFAPARCILGDGGVWFAITTLEGTMRADIGDWIIKGVNGEFYPCKPDIFAKTYERAEV